MPLQNFGHFVKSVIGSNIQDIELWIVHSLWIVFLETSRRFDLSTRSLGHVMFSSAITGYQLPPIYHQLLLPEQFPRKKTSRDQGLLRGRNVVKFQETRSKVSEQFTFGNVVYPSFFRKRHKAFGPFCLVSVPGDFRILLNLTIQQSIYITFNIVTKLFWVWVVNYEVLDLQKSDKCNGGYFFIKNLLCGNMSRNFKMVAFCSLWCVVYCVKKCR